MKFRLPAKYAFLIMNIIILSFFIFYFMVLGLYFEENEGSSEICFRNINFKKEELLIDDYFDVLNLNFGYITFFLKNYTDYKTSFVNYDVLIIVMLFFQIINVIFSFSNMFIWKNAKLALVIDILNKLFLFLFIVCSMIWAILMAKVKFYINDIEIICDIFSLKKYQIEIFWLINTFMPAMFIVVHSFMNYPLYKK